MSTSATDDFVVEEPRRLGLQQEEIMSPAQAYGRSKKKSLLAQSLGATRKTAKTASDLSMAAERQDTYYRNSQNSQSFSGTSGQVYLVQYFMAAQSVQQNR